MSAEISYIQLKVANEARAAVSTASGCYNSSVTPCVAGRGEDRAKETEFASADSALFAGRRVCIIIL